MEVSSDQLIHSVGNEIRLLNPGQISVLFNDHFQSQELRGKPRLTLGRA